MAKTAGVLYRAGDRSGTLCRADTDNFHSSLFLVIFRWLSYTDLPSDLFCVIILFFALLHCCMFLFGLLNLPKAIFM